MPQKAWNIYDPYTCIELMSVALYRSCRLALIAHILLAGLLMDQLQALQQGKADAVWDTKDIQLRVNFVLQHFYHRYSRTRTGHTDLHVHVVAGVFHSSLHRMHASVLSRDRAEHMGSLKRT